MSSLGSSFELDDPELEGLLESLELAGRDASREQRTKIRARIATLVHQREQAASGAELRSDLSYRALINAIDVGFCVIELIFDAEGRAVDYRFLETNPAFEKQTGVVNSLGKRIREIAPSLDEHWFEIYGRVALTGEPIRFENHSEPLHRWFDVYALRVGPPEKRRVALLFTDISERKRAQEALRRSEERFRAVADNIPQLAWMTGPKGEILWFNRRWTEYTGFHLQDMQKLGWSAVHHPEHPHSVVERWNRTLEAGVPWEDTFQLRGRDGTYRWFLSRAFPIRDAQGRISRWFGTNTDITQLRETEEALKKAHEDLQRHAQNLESVVAERTAKLRETVEELEAFSYTVTHDMRGPLRAMQGFAQIVETEYGAQLGPEGTMYMNRIGAAASRLDQLIRDVLAYSRVVRQEVQLHPVDPARLVQQLVDENPALQPPRAEIRVEKPLARVLGNDAFLMQVVSNLLYNAVKFVSPGTQPRVRIWTETVDSQVRLFIRDNGIGIPAEARQKIFGMFQRFHAGSSYEGTGIGLAIVRKAVERMGGSVAVESESGRGSTFIVALQPA